MRGTASQVRKWANGQKSSPPSARALFIRRRRRLFIFIQLVGSNITSRSLEFTKKSIELTNISMDAATISLDRTNKLLDPYLNLFYTQGGRDGLGRTLNKYSIITQ
jgi:hypothetical protein